MTTRHPVAATVTTLEGRRRLSTPNSQVVRDAGYWAVQMAAVAGRGDVASFMTIYDHFAPRLVRYLSGLGTPDARAQELAQEALLRVWRRAESFDPQRASLVTWIFRIARNLYIDSVRSEPNWIPIQEGLETADDDPCPPALPAESLVDAAVLVRAIDALPAVQARLIRMSYLEAKSHSEIASELGMPLGTVKSHLRRALTKLQSSILQSTP